MFKKKCVYMFLCCAMLVTLSGCGGEYAGRERGISGNSISGSAVEEESQESVPSVKYAYANDQNLYTGLYDELEQRDLSGHLIQTWEEQSSETFDEVFYVDNDYLYYIGCESVDQDSIYRIPLQQGEDGNDILLFDQEEKIVEDVFVGYGINGYADSGYLVWVDENDGFVKFDIRKNKKEKGLKNCGGFAVISGKIFASFDGTLYCQELKSDKWKKLGQGYYPFAWNDAYLFYRCDDGYRMYDVKNEKSILLASEDIVHRTAKEQNVDESKMFFSLVGNEELFCDKNKLYLQFCYGLEVGDDEEEDRFALYSMDLGKGTVEINYEKKITDEISRRFPDGSCIAIVNGKLFFVSDEFEDEYGYYDLDTKEVHTFEPEKDPAYYELLSNWGD